MRVLSSELADWDDFDGQEPPPRIPFLSLEASVTDLFQEFAKFTYDHIINPNDGTTNQLLSGIFTYCIDPLLQHETSGAPKVSGDSLLLMAPLLGIDLFEYIEAYYAQSLTTDAQKYYFQFYLHLGLYHFAVWYLCEKRGIPNMGVLYLDSSVNEPKNALFDGALGSTDPNPNNPPNTLTIRPTATGAPTVYGYTSAVSITPIQVTSPANPTFLVYMPIHVFRVDFRDAVTSKVKWRLKRDGIELSDSFYTSTFYLRSFTPEMHINDLVSGECLGVILRQERWRNRFDIFKYIGKRRLKKLLNPMSRQDAVKVFHKLVEAFHGALIEIVDEEIAWLVDRLDAPLRDSYKSITHYGVGDGTPTNALFGILDYGLCFVRYAFDFSADVPKIELEVPDFEILKAPFDSADTNVSILYYGLDATLDTLNSTVNSQTFTIAEAPSVVLKAYSSAGVLNPVERQCVMPNRCFLVQSPGIMTFNDQPISFSSMRGPGGVDATRITAKLRSSRISQTANVHEELVYIVFKNTIPRPPSFPGLYVEKSFVSNEYQVLPADSAAFFASPNDAQTLKNLLLNLEGGNNFDFAVESNLVGEGLGTITESLVIWNKELPASNQVDGSAPNIGALRRSVGYVGSTFDATGAALVFWAFGFVAPPPCSWDTWSDWNAAQKLAAERHIGAHLRHSGNDNIYNPALSAFRAFALFEGMVQRVIAYATIMEANSEINSAGLAAIISKLNQHLKHEAGALFGQPGVPGQQERGPTVLRVSDDDIFNDGLGGKAGTTLLIDYKLFHAFDH